MGPGSTKIEFIDASLYLEITPFEGGRSGCASLFVGVIAPLVQLAVRRHHRLQVRQKVATDLRAVGAAKNTLRRTVGHSVTRSRLSPTRRPEVGGYLSLTIKLTNH